MIRAGVSPASECRGSCAEPDVVDPFQHDDVPDAGLVQGVPGEARLRAGPAAPRSAQHLVAADPLVDHREPRARHRVQSPGQVAGPAVVAADGRLHAVRDRVAECDQGPGRSGRPHVETAEVVPGRDRGHERACLRLGGVVPCRRHPVDLLGVRVQGGRTGPARDVDAHRQFLQRRHLHAHRIAEDLLTRRDPDRHAAAEAHRVDRARDHSRRPGPSLPPSRGRPVAATGRRRWSARAGSCCRRRWGR